MNPELLAAIKERIDLGHSHEQIKGELQAAGYDEEMIEAAYTAAQASGQVPASVPVAPQQAAGGGELNLPSATKLLGNGIAFVQTKLDWVLYLAAPLLVITGLDYLANQPAYADNTAFTIASGGMVAVASVVYLLHLVAALFVVSQAPQRAVGYSEALSWSVANFWRMIWVYILTFLVVWGGFMLLIVPGVIVGIYIYFSQYVFVNEGTRGLAALMRSRELVTGHWGKIFGRLLIIGLQFFLIFLFIGLGIGFASTLTADSLLAELFLNLGFELVGAAISIIGLSIGMELYRHLANARPAPAVPPVVAGVWKYKALAFLGLLFPVVIIVLSVAGVAMMTGFEDSRSAGDSAAVRAQLVEAQVEAALYYGNNSLSYQGMCAEVEPIVSYADGTQCNETADSYALVGFINDDSWCVDSTGYSKRITTGLEDRTSCLPEPVFEEFEESLDTDTEKLKQLEEIMNQWGEEAPAGE